jgi:hypothetical protein
VCAGLWDLSCWLYPAGGQLESVVVSGSGLGWPAVDGESPVRENPIPALMVFPSSSGPVESAVNLPGPPGKPEYFSVTDSGLVP